MVIGSSSYHVRIVSLDASTFHGLIKPFEDITARKENPANYECWYGPCEYTSARLITWDKLHFTHGKVEARLKVPVGQGYWPAFWMLGVDENSDVNWPDTGEIDIMEIIGSDLDTAHGTIHGPGYSGCCGITVEIACLYTI